MENACVVHLSLLSPAAFGVNPHYDRRSRAQTTGGIFIYSRSVELFNGEELLSNNPVLPEEKMVIKQQIFNPFWSYSLKCD